MVCCRDRQATNSGSGPEFFGYSNPTILNLLQKLPNAGRCAKYRFIKFDSPVRLSTKSKTKRKSGKQQRERSDEGTRAKRQRLSVSPNPAVHTSGGSGVVMGGDGMRSGMDPSLAPVLGPGMSQLGLDSIVRPYSSSDEWSSSDTEHELTVDL